MPEEDCPLDAEVEDSGGCADERCEGGETGVRFEELRAVGIKVGMDGVDDGRQIDGSVVDAEVVAVYGDCNGGEQGDAQPWSG